MTTTDGVLTAIEDARTAVPGALKALKRLLAISDGELARGLGMSRQTVNGRLNGSTKLTAEEVAGFAEFFGVPIGVLYLGRNETIRWSLDHPDLTPVGTRHTVG